jgi:hypothetical protein
LRVQALVDDVEQNVAFVIGMSGDKKKRADKKYKPSCNKEKAKR